ncbi:MerR family transcriptional regulator [Nocardia sp. NPDC127526]|uniref:MerR family transcriptional regulator n=1 Tax=Nocardia sp. NPDC127526 TaxID=3345393 RepID=UPI00363CF502
MGVKSLNSAPLRTAEVARRADYSVQQIRNLERDGVLPPAGRTPSGYRVYGDVHVRAARAYRVLAAGVGPVEAKRIVRTARTEPRPVLLALLDAAHARLDRERRDLESACAAVESISAEPIADVRPSDSMTIAELAAALGVRTSTLRHWDATGLVTPARTAPRAPRTYAPADVRDARVVHQLRLAGYGITTLRTLMPHLRDARRWADVHAALDTRRATIESRSRALFEASAELVPLLESFQRTPVSLSGLVTE